MSNTPTHIVYHVKDTGIEGERRDLWTKIGAAWMHKDGKGLNVTLDAVPLDGRLVLRDRDEAERKPMVDA